MFIDINFIRHRSIALALAALGSSFTAHAGDAPASTPVPESAQSIIATAATGVQVYSCELDRNHHLIWTFQHPEAKLYDANGVPIIEHGAGPSWQASDGSRIIGKVITQAPSGSAGSIPQLLLAAHAVANGSLSSVRFVQRLDTVGGVPPTPACSVEHELGSFPYFARYVFLK